MYLQQFSYSSSIEPDSVDPSTRHMFSRDSINLDCSHSRLYGKISFSKFKKLRSLNCSENLITNIKLPKSLKILNCSYNALQTIYSENLVSLKILDNRDPVTIILSSKTQFLECDN